ncbi:hypothetical protein [Curtobacterium sp. VKM Ac-1395]|uniref:hypothetical protein n=1 Tax=Curtobacterium sp. VKM Ac-1395 TaxID=2783815 RepID=UPI00188C42CB|nr:hypothetical protein [Curtobacterium sp. VKM Ac-1395]MBF4591266.1 hypothetical protein [Curtobacterium sp. VKM Ac-1395]
MSPAQPRFVRVTHADAVHSQQAQQDDEQGRDAETRRLLGERAREQKLAEIQPLASAEKRWQGRIRVDRDGVVRQEFSCNCGKHSHGHGTPDHADPFAAITEPTRFEAEPPAWAKRFNARAEATLQEQAAALAARVRATQPQTPPAAAVSQVTSLRAGGGRPKNTDRKRR